MNPLSLQCLQFRQEKQAHRHELFGPVALGTTPDVSRRQTQGCYPYFTQWKTSLSSLSKLGQAGVAGLQKSLYVKSLPFVQMALQTDQEPRKGGFSKGFFVGPSVTLQETKISKDNGPSSTFGTQERHSQRGVHFAKKNFQNPPVLYSSTEQILFKFI